VRFEHLFESGEHQELSQPATIELTEDFFATFIIESAREVSLGGNVDLNTMKANRLKWSQQKTVRFTSSVVTIMR
jgi:hypothetical protein